MPGWTSSKVDSWHVKFSLQLIIELYHEGIRTCDLSVSVLSGSYRRAIVGGISCSLLVRALVCQPSSPGSIPGMSHSETAITRGYLIMLLPPTTFLCTKCLFNYMIKIKCDSQEFLYKPKLDQIKIHADQTKCYQIKIWLDKDLIR
jgi:hypothetical protein